jgi:2-(1,2-epoxy-1,2-dihydrophenyl)acetyl-CoA isomerase
VPVLLVDNPAPHVVRLLINRPEKRNAIDFDVRQAMIDVLPGLLAESGNRALVFGGAGGVFSAGGDLPSMVGLTAAQAQARMAHIHGLCALLAGATIPVVTAIDGFGAGAAVGLALLGDHIVVGGSTKLLFPFMKLGLTPDWGILHSLPRRVGLAAARRLLTEDKMTDGETAFRIGLADEFAADEIMQAAVRRAATLAALPLNAFARMKARLNQPSPSLTEELRREARDQAALLTGPEFAEGHAAFTARRSANFIGLTLQTPRAEGTE